MAVNVTLQPSREPATTLVVVVHGLKRRILETVPPAVAEHLPQADILLPAYDAGPLSNADPVGLAAEISDAIEAQWRRHTQQTGGEYRRIVLIGHSRGALLVRKAYVFARGESQELSRGGLTPAEKGWPRAVERIILLAGMNRGWSLSPKPSKMSRPRWVLLRGLTAIARLTGRARLLREIRRGAPFIANLRVQWIRLNRRGPMPLTVQILGDMDDLVAPGDNIDLQAGQHFVYLNAPHGTTHAGVVELEDADRREVFVRALTREDLVSEYLVPESQREDASVERVVFVLHGIRDFGGWTDRLSAVLEQHGARTGRVVETVRSSYGYFPMTRFLLLSERQKNVRWFMDRYTEVLAKYPNAGPIDFVGHSNGTYLLGSALRRYRACDFGRVVCAGSVLPRNFEWDEMVRDRRITAIRNYLTSADWVVGIFPNLFDRFGDIGGGGFLGFTREPAVSAQFQYVKGGHGGALVADNFESIAAFLLDGRIVDPPEQIRSPEQAPLVLLASKLDWAVWLLLAALLASMAWFVAFGWPAAAGLEPWLRVVIFVALLLAVLHSV